MFAASSRSTEFGTTPLAATDAQTPGAAGALIPAGAHEALVRAAPGQKVVALSLVTPARLVLHHPVAEVITARRTTR